MRKRPSRPLTIALTLACMMMVGVPAARADAVSQINGFLISEDGVRLEGVTVRAHVEPDAAILVDLPAGSVVRRTEVGSAVTGKSGVFQLKIEDVGRATAAAVDGLVAVYLTADTSVGQVYFKVSLAVSEANGRLIAYPPDVSADADPTWDAQLRREGREARQSYIVGAGNGIPQIRLVAMKSSRRTGETGITGEVAFASGMSAAGSYAPDVWCGGNYWFLKDTGLNSGRNVGLMNQYTGTKTTGEFNYKSSALTKGETSITYKNLYIETTLGFNQTQTSASSVTLPLPSSTGAEWYVSHDFRLYDYMCQSGATTWWSGYTENRMIKTTWNTSRRTWTPFTCSGNASHEVYFGPGGKLEIAVGKTTTKSAAFAFAGGGLRAQATWSGTNDMTKKVVYKNVTSATVSTICGDGAHPVNGSPSRTRQK